MTPGAASAPRLATSPCADCGRPDGLRTRTLCPACYMRLFRKGPEALKTYLAKREKPLIDRLLDNAAPGEGDCWLWTGALSKSGYGRIKTSDGHMRPHRAAYEVFIAPIPDGLELDHLCRVRHCINPWHLEPVTHDINMERARLSHCLRGHEFTPENTYWFTNLRDPNKPKRRRRCRECFRLRDAQYNEARKGDGDAD